MASPRSESGGGKGSELRSGSRHLAAALAGAGLVAWLAAFSASGARAGGTAAPPADASVRMTNQLTFEPQEVHISVGGVVEWRNASVLVHTVTADPSKAARPEESVALPEGARPFDSGLLEPESRWRHRFETPGRYRYFCMPHEAAGMVGTVVVEDRQPAPDS